MDTTIGRPRIFKSPQEMQDSIDEYFDSCVPIYLKNDDREFVMVKGKPYIINLNRPSVTGLALHMGFCSRTSFYNYEGYSKDFLYTIKRARARIELSWEQMLPNNEYSTVGVIYGLKNQGYEAQTENTEENSQFAEAIKKALGLLHADA